MSQVVYARGRYLEKTRASIGFEDRGFQFGDGVYEVAWVENGRVVDLGLHFDRMKLSCAQLRIKMPPPTALANIAAQTVRRNFLKQGALYIQLSRGEARREHAFPASSVPTLVMAVYPQSVPSLAAAKVVTMEDFRWGRCDIKATSLLASVLARQKAAGLGVSETWYVDKNGKVLEGAASNAWIVERGGSLRTAPLNSSILGGITRMRILNLAKKMGLKCVERHFTLDEALKAKEAFYTSATQFVRPVTAIDGKPIGNGEVGETTAGLYGAYRRYIQAAGG